MSRDNEKKIGDLLNQMVDRKDQWSEKIMTQRLKSAWDELMGPMIKGYTHKIYYSKDTLFVHLTSSVLRQELSMGREQLRNQLNQKIGAELIQKVVIR